MNLEQTDIQRTGSFDSYELLKHIYGGISRGEFGMDSRYHPKKIVDALERESLRYHGKAIVSGGGSIEERCKNVAFIVNFRLALETFRTEKSF